MAVARSVFSNMGACEALRLYSNELTALPAAAFNGLTNLGNLYLHYNKLAALPAEAFNGLTNLGYLYLRWGCPSSGDNPALTCVALVQALIAAMYDYYGPTVTCQLYCAAGQAAVELPLIAASA